MTFKQRTWAHSHDWFIRTSETLGVIVRGEEGDGCKELEFIDFNELKIWAGY